jgi:hypothetical protein
MILLYLQTQAVRTRSREVELGTSMNAWLTAMGIPVGGKTYQIVREQSRRISRCRLTFFRRSENAEIVTNGAFVRDAILPLNPAPEQLRLRAVCGWMKASFSPDRTSLPQEAAIRQIPTALWRSTSHLACPAACMSCAAPSGELAALRRQFGESLGSCGLPPRRPVTAQARPGGLPEARVNVDERTGLILYPSLPSANGRLSAGSV